MAGRPAIAANVVALAALMFSTGAPVRGAAAPVDAPATWTFNVYDQRAVRWQDPDLTACTAASTEMMLNMIFLGGDVEAGVDAASPRGLFPTALLWRPNTTYAQQETILAYARANMTMSLSSAGTDPHGWRNALNYYGWGSMSAGVYEDSAYSSLDAAAKAVVVSLARYHRPVGVLSRAGRHSQIVNGYTVMGDDPRVGNDFTVVGVYVTDPLRSDATRNTWMSLRNWQSGPTDLRFTPYLETDSPYVDRIDGRVGKTEWYERWVIIDAVR
ncbi:MAG: hypothetical protein ABSE70_00140 [Candidatus Limnocylindrales bacterium]